MRDPNRLDDLYDKIKEIHKTKYPDMRIPQFMSNILGSYYKKAKRDPYFCECKQFVDFIEKEGI